MGIDRVWVMVLDDQSPDGTGKVADDLALTYPGRVMVLHRTGQRGLGAAGWEPHLFWLQAFIFASISPRVPPRSASVALRTMWVLNSGQLRYSTGIPAGALL